MTASAIRDLLRRRSSNVKVLVEQAVSQLYQLVETPYPIYFEQALNCIRLLSKVLPVLIENGESKFVKQLLWGRRVLRSDKPGEYNIKDSKDENGGTSKQDLEPLAVILVNTIFHLLFLPDFTIEDPNVEFTEADVNTVAFRTALMWAPGGKLDF